MRRGILVCCLVAAGVAVLPFSASAKNGFCSSSGDVCIEVVNQQGTILLKISTTAKYFSRYKVCVKGPKSRVCKTFPIKSTGAGYGSTVNWNKNFPYQGHGVYKVTWDASAKTLQFRR